ncbi:hypothetical protein D3C79_629980 [compost metagenome]
MLGQQPGQRDLGRRHSSLQGQLAQQRHQPFIGRQRVGGEARHLASKITRGKGGARLDGAGEEASAQRAERHETYPQLCQQWQDFPLGLAPPEGILALQRRHRLHRVGTPDGLGTGFRQAEVFDLALGNQLFHRAGDLFNGHLGIDAMLIEQIDGLRLQAAQGAFDSRADMLGATVEGPLLAVIAEIEAEFGGDHHPIPQRFQGLTQHLFVEVGAIHLGGVEQGHATLHGGANKGHGLAAIGGGAIALAQSHAAKAECADTQSGLTKKTGLHHQVPQ